MAGIRTDLALEAHELWRQSAREASLPGLRTGESTCRGCTVTAVEITDDAAAHALGKPQGRYLTLDLAPLRTQAETALSDTAQALGEQLQALLDKPVHRALVVGLGNAAMTPDAIGPLTLRHVLITRHLQHKPPFSSLTSVSALAPGVSGSTGLEALEVLRGAVRAAQPEVVIAVDALASRALSRVCSTVQLSDTGIVPGSGVGNDRRALDRETLGVPVIAVGVPTVVDAATLAQDILEEAGVPAVDPGALRGHNAGVMVTPRDIDAQVRTLSRLIGYGIDLALQPLDFETVCALLG